MSSEKITFRCDLDDPSGRWAAGRGGWVIAGSDATFTFHVDRDEAVQIISAAPWLGGWEKQEIVAALQQPLQPNRNRAVCMGGEAHGRVLELESFDRARQSH